MTRPDVNLKKTVDVGGASFAGLKKNEPRSTVLLLGRGKS